MITFVIWALGVLYGIVVAMALFGIVLYKRLNKVIRHAEAVLGLVEKHGEISDSRDERVINAVAKVGSETVRAATVAASAAQAAKQQVETATAKVIDEIKGTVSVSDSGRLPTIRPEGTS